MKILCFGDEHVRDYGSFTPYNRIDSSGLTKELSNILNGFLFLKDQIIQNEPDMVVSLGDTFHSSDYISSTVLYAVSFGYNLIKKACEKLNIPFFIICGNHNYQTKVIQSTSILSGFGTYVSDEYNYSNSNYTFSFISYCEQSMMYKKLLDNKQADIIFTHTDFCGAVYENGVQEQNGLMPDILSNKIISGHIHVPQVLENIIYAGSLVQLKFTRFSNSNTIGGILLYDLDKNKHTFVKNDYSKHYIQVSDVNELELLSPDKHIIKFVSEEKKEEIEPYLKDFEYMFQSITKTEQIRSVYSNFTEIDPLEALKAYVKQNKPNAVDLIEDILK